MNGGRKKKLLIVEDDPDQLNIRALLFERRGYECFCADTPQSALALAAEHHVACVLMDLNLPTQAEGLAFLQRLQALKPAPNVVVLTGRRPVDRERRPELVDVSAIVEKGGATAELFKAVEQACPH